MQMVLLGYPGYLFTGKNSFGSIQDLTFDTGTLIFDTGGAWYHSSGIREKDKSAQRTLKMEDSGMGILMCVFISLRFLLGQMLWSAFAAKMLSNLMWMEMSRSRLILF